MPLFLDAVLLEWESREIFLSIKYVGAQITLSLFLTDIKVSQTELS